MPTHSSPHKQSARDTQQLLKKPRAVSPCVPALSIALDGYFNMNRFLLALLSAVLLISSSSAFAPTKRHNPTVSRSTLDTRHNSLIDTVSSMYNNWGKKATASHILFRPSQFPEDEARVKLTEIKAEVGNDPEKFAAAAREWSGCPSSKNGGDLGEFGPGMMVKNFDAICFNEEVGVVHGPISTQFGEHLILITQRK